MKQFLIIPLGGLGKRFINEGYKTYKPFLKTSKISRVIDNIVNNFPKKNTHVIIVANQKKFNNIVSNFKKKNTTFIKIRNHNAGPVYSLFLAKEKLKEIIKDKSFFVSYSDVNWKWNYKLVKNFICNKQITIFSHNGFHPHLELDNKSDFFLCNFKQHVKKVSEKKTIKSDYKKNNLAIGCYHFKKFQYFEDYFYSKNFKKLQKKKEIYIINLIENCLRNKITINHFRVNKFAHLGVPSQYEDFINWKSIIDKKIESINLNYPSVMLMAGKGKRVKALKSKKPFLIFKKKKIYEYIFKKFGSKKNYIVTNKNYSNQINKKYKIHKIGQSNSMLRTIEKSINFLKDKKNFFILSCDCFGSFEKKQFVKFLKKKKSDVVLFGFKITNLQKKLSNAHTSIKIHKNKIKSIYVKKLSLNHNELGHAGFFWVRNQEVFNYLSKFILKIKFKREVLLDDYFKFLFDKKLCKVDFYRLKEYVHIGSVQEFRELKYWENYFKNENL